MMKCCNHCGALLEDDALACPHCGTAYESATAEPVIPLKVTEESPKPATKKKLSKKAFFFIAGGVLVAVVAIIIAINCIQLSAPLPAVELYGAILNGNTGHLADLAPIEYWEQVAYNTTADEFIERKAQELAYTFGNRPYHKSHDLVDNETVSKDELNSIRNWLQESYQISSDRVKSAQQLILKVVDRDSDIIYTSTNAMIAVQIDSKWYLLHKYDEYSFIIHDHIKDFWD